MRILQIGFNICVQQRALSCTVIGGAGGDKNYMFNLHYVKTNDPKDKSDSLDYDFPETNYFCAVSSKSLTNVLH